MGSNLIYGITDKPKYWNEWVLFPIQQVLAVFVATVLIANICATPVNACLLGMSIGTIVYQIITDFRSPIFISSCGATVGAVCGAMVLGSGNNYLAVTIGGLVILCVYSVASLVVKKFGVEALNKLLPATIVGSITMVIGINLAAFIPTYISNSGVSNNVGVLVALFTMFIVALTSHYFKGFLKTIPFLIGLLGGYLLSVVITLTSTEKLIDFSMFNNIKFFELPDFTFKYWNFKEMSWGIVGQVIIIFLPVSVCALCEHYSDHKVLSNIIGTDLTKDPGLHKTLLGDGVASFIGTVTCGLPNTSYGESIATVGFSRVASVAVITVAAILLGIMSFIKPIQVFIASIPSCVFGGCAMILYGYIFASGLKTILNSKVNLNKTKNLIIVSVILCIGVSGIYLFHSAFAGVSLAMVVGVILNLILRDRVE